MEILLVHKVKPSKVPDIQKYFHHGVNYEHVLMRYTLVELVEVRDHVDGNIGPKIEATNEHVKEHASYQS